MNAPSSGPRPRAGRSAALRARPARRWCSCEAAGYDVVLVETVGVGQSETTVANMTDCFLVLMLARTGDALQGIKKGVLELADVLAVNKADGAHEPEAKAAARELTKALALIYPPGAAWVPPVLTCSAMTGTGIDEVWGAVERHREAMEAAGSFTQRRARQQVDWMWSTVEEHLLSEFRGREAVRERADHLEQQLREGKLTATAAARALLAPESD